MGMVALLHSSIPYWKVPTLLHKQPKWRFIVKVAVVLPQWTGSKFSKRKMCKQWDYFHLQTYPLVVWKRLRNKYFNLLLFLIDRFVVFLCQIRGEMREKFEVFKLQAPWISSEMVSNHSEGKLLCVTFSRNPQLLSSFQNFVLYLI